MIYSLSHARARRIESCNSGLISAAAVWHLMRRRASIAVLSRGCGTLCVRHALYMYVIESLGGGDMIELLSISV